MIWNKTLIRGTSSGPSRRFAQFHENDFDVEHRMTAGIATEDGRRVALAITTLAFGWVLLNEPLGIFQTPGGVLILFGIWIALPRTGRIEAGP